MAEQLGFCPSCKAFRPDAGNPFQRCPSCKRAKLLHRHQCQSCDVELFFQVDDDYCGPDNEVICGACCRKLIEELTDEMDGVPV